MAKKEMRVYIVTEEHESVDYENLSDDEFMELAEEQGTAYTLKSFQNAYNCGGGDEINPDYSYIRFIEV